MLYLEETITTQRRIEYFFVFFLARWLFSQQKLDVAPIEVEAKMMSIHGLRVCAAHHLLLDGLVRTRFASEPRA